jgi:hypothetical protein
MPRSSRRIWAWIGTVLALAVLGAIAAVATGQFAPGLDGLDTGPSLASIMLPTMTTVTNVAPSEQPRPVEIPVVATPAVAPTIPLQPTITELHVAEDAPARDEPVKAPAKAPAHPTRHSHAKRTAATATTSAKHPHRHAAPAPEAEEEAASAPVVQAPSRPSRPQAQADDSERPSALNAR